MFLTKGIHSETRKVNPLRLPTQHFSLLHARSHSASPPRELRYPSPPCMQVQKIPDDEFSSPCCKIREKTWSPGDQNLSSSPLGLFAAHWCPSNGLYERVTAIPEFSWLHEWCWSSSLGKGRKPKASSGAGFPLLFIPMHWKRLDHCIPTGDGDSHMHIEHQGLPCEIHEIKQGYNFERARGTPRWDLKFEGGLSHWIRQKFSPHLEEVGWGRVSSKTERKPYYSCSFPTLPLYFALGLRLEYVFPLRSLPIHVCYVLPDFF